MSIKRLIAALATSALFTWAGPISTIVGNGTPGFSGDGGPATAAQLNTPSGVAYCDVDPKQALYIADTGNHRIRKVVAGVITTIAGTGVAGFSGDSGQATAAQLNGPFGVAVDYDCSNLYVADRGNHRVRKINLTTGVITTFAGNGVQGFSGDGGSATSAQLNSPSRVAVASFPLVGLPEVLISDTGNHRIRSVPAVGANTITTYAGTGTPGFNGYFFPYASAQLNSPVGIAIPRYQSAGLGRPYPELPVVLLGDTGNQMVRNLSTGTLVEPGLAVSPVGVASTRTRTQVPIMKFGASGGPDFYADAGRHQILNVRYPILSVAGMNGQPGYSGDGADGGQARLNAPQDVTADGAGVLKVADTGNHVIREVFVCSDNRVLTAAEKVSWKADTECQSRHYRVDLNAGDDVLLYADPGRTEVFTPGERLAAVTLLEADTESPYASTVTFKAPTTGRYPVVSSCAPGATCNVRVWRTGDPCFVDLLGGNRQSIPGNFSVEPRGGTMTIAFSTQPGCSIPAAAQFPWFRVVSVTNNIIKSFVTVQVDPNYSNEDRMGLLTVGTQTLVVEQKTGACLLEAFPATVNAPADGMTGLIAFNHKNNVDSCQWTAVGGNPASIAALEIFTPTGNFPDKVSYRLKPNVGSAPRTVTLKILNATVTFTQAAAGTTPRRNFIRLVYYSFLGRLPSASELNFQDASGLSYGALASNLLNSSEFNALGRFSAGLYLGILNRDPEYSGWRYQRQAMMAGFSPLQLIQNFILSPEYQLKFGVPDNAGFVTLLYRNVLGREPSPQEVAFQAGALSGITRQALAQNFLNAPEFQTNNSARLLGSLLYFTILLRDPTPAERTWLTDLLKGGFPVGTAIDNFSSSPELMGMLQ